jgi:hypothetical protein
MSRWPAIVGVVTEVPSGHLFEPLEVKVTSAPGEVDTAYRSANQANVWTRDCRAAAVGAAVLVSPIRHTSWVKPWFPPVASPATGPSRLPCLASQIPPSESMTKL